MLKILSVLFVLTLVGYSHCLTRSIQEDIRTRLINNYCPFYGFVGPMCPQDSAASSTNDNAQMLGGLGYNAATRELRWPIYASKATPIDLVQAIETKRFTNLGDFVANMGCANYQTDPAPHCRGGLYVGSNEFINLLVDTFSDYHQDMAISQSNYQMFDVQNTASGADFLPEFDQFLHSIPPVYDPANTTLVQMYTALFDEFGTHAATNMKFGGTVFLMVDLKTCTSQVQDLEAELQYYLSNPFDPSICSSFLENGYCQYRIAQIYERTGGAPDIDLKTNPQAAIASMRDNPVVVSFDTVPLHAIVPEEYRSSTSAAFQDYIRTHQTADFDSLQAQILNNQRQKWLGPQEIKIFHGNTEQVGIPTIIDSAAPNINTGQWMYVPRWNIQRWDVALSAGQSYMFCTYINFQQQGVQYYIDRGEDGNVNIRLQIGAEDLKDSENPYDCYKDLLWWHWNAETTALNHDFISPIAAGDSSSKPVMSAETEKLLTPPVESSNSGYCTTVKEMYLPDQPEKYTTFTACIDILSFIVSSPAQYSMENYDVGTACAGF